ncbi:MAG: ABC transporter permease [Acidobacteriota bacterium]
MINQRVFSISKKEFKQIRRDLRTLILLLIFPSFLLILYGYALNFDVKHIRMGIYDQSCTKKSRDFINSLIHSEYFYLKKVFTNSNEIDEYISKGEISVTLIIPNNFSKSIERGNMTSVQIIIDGSDSNTSIAALGYLNSFVQNFTVKIINEKLKSIANKSFQLPINSESRMMYNPELKTSKFLIPGLIVFILMITSVVSTTMSLVKEKEKGTIEQLKVTPIKPSEIIAGKTLPYVLVSLFSTTIILIVGWLLFDISIKGSLLLLFMSTLIFLIGALGYGLFISSIVESQQVAFMIALLTTMLPTVLLSGFIFPIKNMPAIIQWITFIVPARYFLVILRAIILKGAGFLAFWEQIVALVIFSSFMIVASSIMINKRLK